MRRVRAAALVLVNWKGVFYERYLLDEAVTALEGDNGAGKTTVMIGAYVVMLPDMTRLRFTNVGEGDPTGGDRGIWGRLGNPKRPSYAVLEFDIAGERLLAGVRLERKGEPSVELTPFLISELPSGVRHQDVLLLRSDEEDLVPELADLRHNVGRLGGRIQVFRTAKEYFAALFDRGVTPLRLAVDDERTRYNDMLRTSMTGGLSRALTSEFRSFLLKEEGGLADTLVRMRGNLDACRRTRTEVTEARALEGEISGVYEAGLEMFVAALLAVRERAAELRRRVVAATAARDEALAARDEVKRGLERSVAERDEMSARLRRSEDELRAATDRRDRVVRAAGIAQRVQALDGELADVDDLLRARASERDEARAAAERRADERKRAEDAFRSAAEGLAEFRRGLEELHRRADAYRTVTRNLERARTELERPDLAAEDVEEQERRVGAEIEDVDQRRQDLDAQLSLMDARRVDHERASAALARIEGRDVDAAAAHEAARRALGRLAGLEDLARRVEALNAELERTRAACARQVRARAAAAELAGADEELDTSAAVRQALAGAEADERAHADRARAEALEADDCRRRSEVLNAREEELRERSVRWRELDAVASRLQERLGVARRTATALESAREVLDGERDDARWRFDTLRREREEVEGRAGTLERTGGLYHEDLLAARDIVGGELLAGQFDDVDPAEAGRIQARLGPLADAIVVNDGREAARMLAGKARALDSVWFVEGGGLHELVGREGTNGAGAGESDEVDASHGIGEADEVGRSEAVRGSKEVGGSDDVVVAKDGVVRTTRVPARPTLGRKARQRLVTELRARADDLRAQRELVEAELVEIDACRRDIALLTREADTLETGDPEPELAEVRREAASLAERMGRHGAVAREAERRAGEMGARRRALGELLAEAYLLDEPDLSVRVAELEDEVGRAGAAGAELARLADPRSILIEHLDALRRPPRAAEDLGAMRSELEELGILRARRFLALEALRYVATHREALDWTDAEEALSERVELVPALELQYEKAERVRRDATSAAARADDAFEEARRAWRDVDDRRSAKQAARDEASRELMETGVDDPSPAAVERARAEVERLDLVVRELHSRQGELTAAVARLEERLSNRAAELATAEAHLEREERELKPAAEAWERLRSRSEERGLITPAITTRLLSAGTGSVNLRLEAQRWRTALEERLGGARDAAAVLEEIHSWLSAPDQTTGDEHVRTWEAVRDWIRRRVPAQITEVDDPLDALQRLKRHLSVLGERLEKQEAELRGASEDVARGIDVHLRSAQRQVRALNDELEGVGFGTIGAIRIRLVRDDRMEGVLNALRRGSAQELLFAPAMPIEEALDELFSRYGGRGETLGRRLLDYREYVETVVEVRRNAGPDWERVNPSRLSTGEAIGVGTALMMVVLTAWERSANLFRAKRSLGTLRLLFLDEANRLSQDNLDVLFELCGVLHLQLLIASPEVARGPGCTTYRLVRRTTTGGGEEVLVSGRRTVAEGDGDVGA